LLRLPSRFRDAIIQQAVDELPNECCGLIGGRDGLGEVLYPIRNADASPYRYNMDPRDLMRALNQIEEQGREVLVIYHSHTHTEAYPSSTDVALAAPNGFDLFPDSYYLLVSLKGYDEQKRVWGEGTEPVVRAFTIREGSVSETPIEYVAG
jgi:proteasome lid subunit RPN8/RPN11